MTLPRGLLALLLFLALSTGAWAQPLPGTPRAQAAFPGQDAIAADRIRSDLAYLTSDALQGRGSGDKGGYAAGNWIGWQLNYMGLAGAGVQGYYQPFRVEGRNMRNVIATIPGTVDREVVVIGAHYDHLGLGYQRGSREPGGGRGQIHNGADDNGSGTSALLAVCRAFVESGMRFERRLVFCFFDAEERGLHGSWHFTRSPTVRGKIVLMINLDMVGRLRQKLELTGAHTGGQNLRRYIANANRDLRIPLSYDGSVNADSDHFPFYKSGSAILFPFTGFHADYHRPSDDLDKINMEGIEKVARFAYGVAYQAAKPVEAKMHEGFTSVIHDRMSEPAPAGVGSR